MRVYTGGSAGRDDCWLYVQSRAAAVGWVVPSDEKENNEKMAQTHPVVFNA